MESTLQAEFRSGLVKESQQKAFSHLANAAYDESRIPEIEKLRGPVEEKIQKLQEEHDALTQDPESHKKTIRTRIKELKEQIDEENAYLKGIDESVAIVQKSVKEQRTKADQLLSRVAFFEGFTYEPGVTKTEDHGGTES